MACGPLFGEHDFEGGGVGGAVIQKYHYDVLILFRKCIEETIVLLI